MTYTFTDINVNRRGSSVEITASAPDMVSAKVVYPAEDIKKLFGISIDKWMMEHADNEETLWEMFYSIHNMREINA